MKKSASHHVRKQVHYLKDKRPGFFWLGVVSSSITITKEVVNTINLIIDYLI